MMSNGSAEMTFPASAGKGIEKLKKSFDVDLSGVSREGH